MRSSVVAVVEDMGLTPTLTTSYMLPAVADCSTSASVRPGVSSPAVPMSASTRLLNRKTLSPLERQAFMLISLLPWSMPASGQDVSYDVYTVVVPREKRAVTAVELAGSNPPAGCSMLGIEEWAKPVARTVATPDVGKTANFLLMSDVGRPEK